MNNSLNYDTALNVIRGGNHCLLGVVDENGAPYIVPVSYRLENLRDDMKISMISRKDSKKVNCIKNNDKVTLYFKNTGFSDMLTVIASGTASIVEKDDMVFVDVKVDDISGRYFN